MTAPHGEGAERLDEIAAVHARLRADAAALDDAAAREATRLPGWSRGHVLTHLGDLARAFARQARYALEGRTVEVYDGGRPGRDAGIERGAGRSAAELRESLEDGLTRLEKAWAELGPDDWSLRCAYRDADVLATQLCWWREAHIHYADLGTGYRPEEWGDALGAHLVEYLLPRLPAARTTVLLSADTARRWEYGAGTPTTVHGTQNTLAAWLAGRSAAELPKGYGSTDSLPDLGPWP
ncbi:maleylpyruvate isomerase family mycothiol-dependent enzyme [Streptomyces sp. NPDC049910]|uniref:maleylpyruvate isomerase family mycothiol-dependent enzyme n=1 Tax=Streptomyces sp. NPDC049910 TaxID=3155278 RepID=UPI00344384D7